MSDGLKLSRSILFLISVFCATLALTAVTGRMIITDTMYVSVSPDLSAVSMRDTVSYFVSTSRSSSLQMLFVFLAGFSSLAVPVSAFVSAFRGLSLGYTAAVAARGSLSASSSALTGVIAMLPNLSIYFLSSVLIILFSSIALTYAGSECRNKDSCAARKRFIISFLVLSGAIFTADSLRMMLL